MATVFREDECRLRRPDIELEVRLCADYHHHRCDAGDFTDTVIDH